MPGILLPPNQGRVKASPKRMHSSRLEHEIGTNNDVRLPVTAPLDTISTTCFGMAVEVLRLSRRRTFRKKRER